MGQFEVFQQLLVRRRLLQWGEIGSMKVLDQRVLDAAHVGRRPHHGGDGRQPGSLCGPPAPLPRDQLIAAIDGTDQDRLEDADLSDRRRQLPQRVLVEVHPGLVRVRVDVADRQVDQRRLDAESAASGSDCGISELRPLPKPLRRDTMHLLGDVAVGNGTT